MEGGYCGCGEGGMNVILEEKRWMSERGRSTLISFFFGIVCLAVVYGYQVNA